MDGPLRHLIKIAQEVKLVLIWYYLLSWKMKPNSFKYLCSQSMVFWRLTSISVVSPVTYIYVKYFFTIKYDRQTLFTTHLAKTTIKLVHSIILPPLAKEREKSYPCATNRRQPNDDNGTEFVIHSGKKDHAPLQSTLKIHLTWFRNETSQFAEMDSRVMVFAACQPNVSSSSIWMYVRRRMTSSSSNACCRKIHLVRLVIGFAEPTFPIYSIESSIECVVGVHWVLTIRP